MRITDHWSQATLRRVHELTPTVREFELVPEDGVRPFSPGSHVNLRVRIGQDGAVRDEMRSYSLVGRPDGDCYRIAVRRIDPGRGGSRYLWSLGPGARIEMSAPANHFELDLEAPQVLLVAGGIGITPLVGMAEALVTRGAAVAMCYGARNRDELAYLGRLEAALGERLRTFLSDDGVFIDFGREFAALAPSAQAYVCGPAPMLEAARSAWAAAGRPAANLRFETFASSGRFAAQRFTVSIAGSEHSIVVEPDRSLLDAMEDAGIAVLSDCRRGECGLCALEVLALEGEIDHRDVFLSDHEKSGGGRICACVSRVAGAGAHIVVDSGWRPDTLPRLA